jgi:putative transposase
MPQSFASMHAHFVFSTKNRVPDIHAEWRPRLHEYIGGILRAKGCVLIAAGGMPDHMHLLVSLARTISIAETVGLVKANASGWIHDTFEAALLFDWQDGYAAFAVSFSDLDAVTAYIANQEEHHRKRDFKAELLALLKKHHLAYDERYLWD